MSNLLMKGFSNRLASVEATDFLTPYISTNQSTAYYVLQLNAGLDTTQLVKLVKTAMTI